MQEYLGNNGFNQSDLNRNDALRSSADQVSGNQHKSGLRMEKDLNTTVLKDLDQFYIQDWKLFEILHLIRRCGKLLKHLQYQNLNHEGSGPLAFTSPTSAVFKCQNKTCSARVNLMTITPLLFPFCVRMASTLIETSDGNQDPQKTPLLLQDPLPKPGTGVQLSAFNPISTSLQKIYLDCLLFHKGLQKSVVIFDTLL